MHKTLVFRLLLLLVVGAMLLTACAPTATPATPEEPVATEKPTAPPEEEEEQEEPTPIPPTEAPEEPAEPEEPVEFVVAHPGPIYTMDAPVTWYGSTHWLTNLLYDCLIWRNADGSGFHGQAAESWENIDPVTWRFHLRPGLTFHNGEPLDAHAVKWNIDRVRTREDFMVRPQWDFVEEVVVVDDLTVDVITPQPHAYFEYDIAYNGCELLPPGYIEEVGEEEFARNPVGSGPYKLAEFTADERYVFEAWSDYWGGQPEVDRVVYQVIPETASQVGALLAGQIDLMNNVPLPDRDKVCGTEGIECVTMTSGRGHNLRMRMETESGGLLEKYPGYEPTTMDQRIRHAISHALDRTLLAEIHGSAYPKLVRVGYNQPETQAYADKYLGPEACDRWYDPELSKQLILEAGYDPDAGNKPLVHLDAPDYWYGGEKESAEAVAAMLEEVGFEVELNVLDKSAVLEQIYTPGYNREILFLTTAAGSANLIPLFFTCDWWCSYYHICDPELDAVSKEIQVAMDPDERLALWGEWWEEWLDVGDTACLYEILYAYAINEEFEWQPRVDGWVTLRDLKVRK